MYSHLLEYGMNEKAKYIETIHAGKLDLDKFPGSTDSLKMLPQDVLDRTNRAYTKIQNKFVELKNKLNRLNSKEHK